MELSVYKIDGTESGKKVTLDPAVFGIEPNNHAIYLDVKQYLANQRQGTHKTKEKWEVAYSTKKVIRQKGSGGARHGSIKANIYVGGGRVFGPTTCVSAQPLTVSISGNGVVVTTGGVQGLAAITQTNLAAGTVEDLVAGYGNYGWKADDAVIRALAYIESPTDFEAISTAIRSVYLPWAEESARHLQKIVDGASGHRGQPQHGPPHG